MPADWFNPVIGLGSVVITTCGGIAVAWMNGRFKKLEVMSKPTSNGFAAGVKAALERIEERQLLTDKRLDGLTDRLDDHLDHKDR